jgi:hypothetical protein
MPTGDVGPVASADFMVCVDVDERLDVVGLRRLVEAAESSTVDVAFVQASKYDAPVTRSLWATAFSASYRSWFRWQAGAPVPASGTSVLLTSYYGSMAALRLSELDRAAGCLGSRAASDGPFDDGCAVEDFPLYSQSLCDRTSVLLEDRVGAGDAPADYWAYHCLWRRWTAGNVPLGPAYLRRVLRGPHGPIARVAAVHHVTNWYASVAVGLLPLLTVLSGFVNGPWRHAAVIVAFVAVIFDVVCMTLPCPDTGFVARLSRLPCESLLWPAGLLGVLTAHRRPSTALADYRVTPRQASRLPPRLVCVLALEAAALVTYLGLSRPALLETIILVPACTGLTALLVEQSLRRRAIFSERNNAASGRWR